MKTLFIETKRKFEDSDIKYNLLDDLKGETISLAATIQYIGLISKVKLYLESKGKKVIIKQGGCNSSAFDKSADILLMITDGTFHAINNAIQIQREIYVFTTQTLEKIKQKEIDVHNKRISAKQKKFLMFDIVGLLISTKYGQKKENIHKIKNSIEKLGKKVYIFEANNINSFEFENFPQIQIWVNTACSGLARDDSQIINLADILEFL